MTATQALPLTGEHLLDRDFRHHIRPGRDLLVRRVTAVGEGMQDPPDGGFVPAVSVEAGECQGRTPTNESTQQDADLKQQN
jgi:hypothetical protein